MAVLDGTDRPSTPRARCERAEPVLTVPFGEALPAWRVALYAARGRLPARRGAPPGDDLHRPHSRCCWCVIARGLVATYRLVRRETEMARLKSDFVANVSHDLKTPLALIRMFGETLEMDRVPDEATPPRVLPRDHAGERAAVAA